MTYEDAVQKLNIVLGIENQHDRSLRDVYDDALLDLFTFLLDRPRTYVSIGDLRVVLTILEMILKNRYID